jgi:hypothetical protein
MTTTAQQQISIGEPRQWRERGSRTPAWLRAMTAILVALAVLSGVAAGLSVLSRAQALNRAKGTTEPLVVDAQTALVKLSDANTTEAQGFLSGAVIPAAAQSRYANDLTQATASLTAAAQRAGTDRQVTAYLQTLNADLPVYSGIVATATADNRQGQPVGAAYLAEANHFMEAGILPAAISLYTAQRTELSHDRVRATNSVPVIVVFILLALLLVVAVYLQAGLARRFRRLLNTGALVATLAAVTLAVWLIIAFSAEGAAVWHAATQGTDPLGVLTQARILTSQARADDELTLVTRDADPAYQNDYASVSTRLTHLIGEPLAGWSSVEAGADRTAIAVWQDYDHAHQTVRGDDKAGHLSDAVSVDQRRSAVEAATMDAALAGGVDSAAGSFGTSVRDAGSDLSGLTWVAVALMALVVIGVLAGTAPRLREYR